MSTCDSGRAVRCDPAASSVQALRLRVRATGAFAELRGGDADGERLPDLRYALMTTGLLYYYSNYYLVHPWPQPVARKSRTSGSTCFAPLELVAAPVLRPLPRTRGVVDELCILWTCMRQWCPPSQTIKGQHALTPQSAPHPFSSLAVFTNSNQRTCAALAGDTFSSTRCADRALAAQNIAQRAKS